MPHLAKPTIDATPATHDMPANQQRHRGYYLPPVNMYYGAPGIDYQALYPAMIRQEDAITYSTAAIKGMMRARLLLTRDEANHVRLATQYYERCCVVQRAIVKRRHAQVPLETQIAAGKAHNLQSAKRNKQRNKQRNKPNARCAKHTDVPKQIRGGKGKFSGRYR